MEHIAYKVANLMRSFGYDFHEEGDSRVKAMKSEIRQLGSIEFKIEVEPNGSWVAESTNIDGIISGGRHLSNMDSALKDAIFTYFEIPPHLCNDTLLKEKGETARVIEKVYA